MLIRFGPIGTISTRDKLLGEVYQELSNYYRALGPSSAIVSEAHGSDLLLEELEREYSNRM